MNLSHKIFDSEEGMLRLKDDWCRLHGEISYATVFNSWEWQYLWWKHYKQDKILFIICILNDNKVTAIFPFYKTTKKIYSIFRINVVRLIGNGGDTSPDYLSPLVKEPIDAIHMYLVRFIKTAGIEWNIYILKDITNNYPIQNFLNQLRRKKMNYIYDIDSEITYLEIPSNWDKYISSKKSRRRNKINKLINKLYGNGDIKIETIDTIEQLKSEHIKNLINLHTKRWSGRSKNYAFNSDQYINFHTEVIHELIKSNNILLFNLYFNDQIIATYYCLIYKDSVYYYQGGYDTDYKHLVPGYSLMILLIRYCISKKYRELDMMKGQYSYKNELADERRFTIKLTIYKSKLSFWIYKAISLLH